MELHCARPKLASKNRKDVRNFYNVRRFDYLAWFFVLFCQHSIPRCQFATTTTLLEAFRSALRDRKLFWCFLNSYKLKWRTAQGHWSGSGNILILDPLLHCGTSLCATQFSLKKPKRSEKFLQCHPEHKIWLFGLIFCLYFAYILFLGVSLLQRPHYKGHLEAP